ncbi:T9SS C-terminal target domain-containing protein [Chitinophaga silvatica]|uniref:T9SS C-terminal target domain-containing protein n=1 Tax=Chitinophaga silvatica TaxID=2282649 RepID=A0A3E1Y2M6_9BACT|nr:T9SS type A sorting domain-containing protein [Chitinophaga silvatica]RFS18767.1 T9SS C-terminal target domain-containing protein [Chitinophaga silvatica]
MKNLLFLLILAIFPLAKVCAQSLPPNTCGLVYTYDAAGNRTQRMYVCNNARVGRDTATAAVMKELNADAIVQVNAIYPNPTTGIFQITFTKALKQARVSLIDLSGHILKQQVESGSILTYDISNYPAGVYYIKITEGSFSITHKLIKQ